ncbi:MAG: thymidine kinase [Bacteroidales bacterium]
MSKLYYRYGTMCCGKSAQLLIAAHNYLERGMQPMLFTFEGDVRSGVGVIKSRIGIEMKALTFNSETNMEDGFGFEGVDAVFIDEAQFLTAQQVEELHRVAINRGIPVLCYGLRTDFLGRLFTGSMALMAHAEAIEELKTICDCGNKATHVRRFKDGVVQLTGETIQIGDLEYKSMCYKCFNTTN